MPDESKRNSREEFEDVLTEALARDAKALEIPDDIKRRVLERLRDAEACERAWQPITDSNLNNEG